MRGLLQTLPVTGVLWVAGFLAITGSPPFGPFLSELMILKGALEQGQTAVAVGYLLLLGVVFVGMASIVLAHGLRQPRGHRGRSRAQPRRLGRRGRPWRWEPWCWRSGSACRTGCSRH